MPIPYSSALRIYAKQSGGSFMIPKKGSKQYEEVKKIQSETEMSAEHAVKKRSKKVKAKAESESDVESTKDKKSKKGMPNEMKLKAGTSPSVSEEVPPPKTKPIDVPEAQIKENKIVKRPTKAKAKKELPAEVKIQAQDFIVNQNTGPSQTISADYADQKKNIKKELKEKVPKIVETKPKTGNETIDGMVSINPSNISGNAPFDMSALRSKLLF